MGKLFGKRALYGIVAGTGALIGIAALAMQFYARQAPRPVAVAPTPAASAPLVAPPPLATVGCARRAGGDDAVRAKQPARHGDASTLASAQTSARRNGTPSPSPCRRSARATVPVASATPPRAPTPAGRPRSAGDRRRAPGPLHRDPAEGFARAHHRRRNQLLQEGVQMNAPATARMTVRRLSTALLALCCAALIAACTPSNGPQTFEKAAAEATDSLVAQTGKLPSFLARIESTLSSKDSSTPKKSIVLDPMLDMITGQQTETTAAVRAAGHAAHGGEVPAVRVPAVPGVEPDQGPVPPDRDDDARAHRGRRRR